MGNQYDIRSINITLEGAPGFDTSTLLPIGIIAVGVIAGIAIVGAGGKKKTS